MTDLTKQIGIPREYSEATLENSEQTKLILHLQEYLEDYPEFKRGKWLLGEYGGLSKTEEKQLNFDGKGVGFGTGKTHSVCAFLNSLAEKIYTPGASVAGKSILFVQLEDLLNAYLKNPPIFDKYLKCVYLVVDDVGDFSLSEKQGNLQGAVLNKILRGRAYEGKPTMFTTNLKPDAAAQLYGKRFYLYMEGCCDIVAFKDKNRHGLKKNVIKL